MLLLIEVNGARWMSTVAIKVRWTRDATPYPYAMTLGNLHDILMVSFTLNASPLKRWRNAVFVKDIIKMIWSSFPSVTASRYPSSACEP